MRKRQTHCQLQKCYGNQNQGLWYYRYKTLPPADAISNQHDYQQHVAASAKTWEMVATETVDPLNNKRTETRPRGSGAAGQKRRKTQGSLCHQRKKGVPSPHSHSSKHTRWTDRMASTMSQIYQMFHSD